MHFRQQSLPSQVALKHKGLQSMPAVHAAAQRGPHQWAGSTNAACVLYASLARSPPGCASLKQLTRAPLLYYARRAHLDDVHLHHGRGEEAVHVQVLQAGPARLGHQVRERVLQAGGRTEHRRHLVNIFPSVHDHARTQRRQQEQEGCRRSLQVTDAPQCNPRLCRSETRGWQACARCAPAGTSRYRRASAQKRRASRPKRYWSCRKCRRPATACSAPARVRPRSAAHWHARRST